MSSPSIVSTHQVRAFRCASHLPKEVWRALMQNEAPANVILPSAAKALDLPCGDDSEQRWLAVYDGWGSVEFVLSCTQGPQGKYPIFIVACKSSAQLAQENSITDALLPLVRCLMEEIPPQRVFSVFSVAKVTETFAEIFEGYVGKGHGIKAYPDPYYDATFTFCTRETLRAPRDAVTAFPGLETVDIALRRGEMPDLKGIAALCKAFSETSPPFVLNDAGAELEAKIMIENQKVWVHTIRKDGQEPEIACLVATTRESDSVTAVTKVFTAPRWRGRGCAGRLLYRVCEEILQKKKRIVLYVGNSKELLPARKVYHKIGFQGLFEAQSQQVKGVERWLEIGFKGTTLGYW